MKQASYNTVVPVYPAAAAAAIFYISDFRLTVMGRRASNGPRSMTVQVEVSVNSASANSSGVATLGPIDCEQQQQAAAGMKTQNTNILELKALEEIHV